MNVQHTVAVAAAEPTTAAPKQRLVGLQNLAFRLNHIPLTRPVARVIEIVIRLVFSATLPAKARIHHTVHFGHNALGVILNPMVVIEEACQIGAHVVMGGKAPLVGAPHIERNVTIHAGAKLIGPVIIGEGSVVGANAVVVKNIPPYCVVVGIPGEVIKQGIDPVDYRPSSEGQR